MKITKTADEVDFLKTQKEKANIDCDKCPGCGKENGFQIGIMKSWCEGFFKIKHYRIDCYSCRDCGCEWESNKYEW